MYRQVKTGFPAIFTFRIEIKNPNMHFQQFIYTPGTQHWVSEFHTFDDAPEVFTTYQLRNSKSNQLYTGKFSIHVIDLTRIDLATEEDKHYEIDRWAKLFKAAIWEELKMIAKNDPDLMQASDELYKVNKDDILRQQARARADAEFWEKVHNARMEKMRLFPRKKMLF